MKSNNAMIESAFDALYDFLMVRHEHADLFRGFDKGYTPGFKAADVCYMPEAKLFDCMMELRESIAQTSAKASGRGDLRKAMVGVLKNADASRPALQKAYYDEAADCTVVCDSYQLIKAPGREYELPYLTPDDGPYFDYKRILPRTDVEMKLPALGELKAWVKLHRKDPEVNIGGDMHYPLYAADGSGFCVWVNPKYLRNMLEAVGDGAVCHATLNKPYLPVVVESLDSAVYTLIVPMRIVK